MVRLNTPVLLIIYKRIGTTRQVLDQIRKAKPAKLYISANGPNPKVLNEGEKCDEARSIIDEIDWECQVIKNFRSSHLSAKESISSGITWFFNQEEEGIILEDDCVVDSSFFLFSQELLEKYRNHPTVMHIGASNFQNVKRGDKSYYFSNYNHIWGWAGWRRSWLGYDVNFCSQPVNEFQPVLEKIFNRKDVQQFWLEIYKYLKSGNIDTWDTQYMFHLWKKDGISIVPNVNLVRNIGFGDGATNTQSSTNKWANLELGFLDRITHPSVVKINNEADDYTSDYFFQITKSSRYYNLKIKISKYIPLSLKRKLKALLN